MTDLFKFDPTKPCRVCGRKGVHCPNCGSYSRYSYARKGRKEKLPNGEVIEILGYKCRRCGYKYPEDTLCEAPPLPSPVVGETEIKVTPQEAKESVRVLASIVNPDKLEALRQHLGLDKHKDDAKRSMTDTTNDEFFRK